MELFHVNSGSPVCFLVVFLLHVTDAAVPSNILTEHTELLQKLKSYEIIKPYRLEGRTKRYASTNSKDGHVQETALFLDGIKNHFTLDIFLNKDLFSPNYSEKHVLHDGTRVEVQKPHEHCFYQGRVRGMDNSSSVSLSTCNGIEGIISTDKGLFFIYPLKSKEGNVLEEHLVFSNSDLDEEHVTCGHSHLISPKKELNHLKQISKTERRVRRSVQSETKYVELFIINDFSQYEKHKADTELRAKQLANHLDSLYRPQHVRIALVKIETWKDRDLISVNPNATITLSNFNKYKRDNLDKDRGAHWDNIQFLTGIDFLDSTVGYAHIKTICGTRSVAVVQDHNSQAAVTAATMAHELGHNFGMIHDTTTCECPDKGKCIMSAILSVSSPATRFSTCSLDKLRTTLNEGYGTCLFDEPKMLTGPPICGNGFVEEGEQCDCGTPQECKTYENQCCNATTCMLHPGAACSHGECCFDCQLRSKGHSCRKRYDECDLPEYCTGSKELCPEDTSVHDGFPCNKKDGYCYSGVCQSHKLQCRYLFGKGVIEGNDLCFNRNLQENPFFGCYDKTRGNHPCDGLDVKCGRIHCLSHEIKRPVIGQDRSYYSVTVDGRRFCLVPLLTTGDGQDLQYVQDGTKCGQDMMCKESKCLPISQVISKRHWQRCPTNCSGNGVCNNKGHCHCVSGYACPDCTATGSDSGGSVDSGQGCKMIKKKVVGGVNIAAAVLIPLFLILLIVIIAVVYIKRRKIQERLNHYKLVRRTASTPQPSRSLHTNTPRPTISGPTTVSVHAPDSAQRTPTRREAPVRPSAAEDKYPASGAWRPPFVPTQPNTTKSGGPWAGHQSVPLFPPSAPQEPQEPAKRPPPPRPEPEYQNVPPKAPARAFPGKPKLPPSRPSHGSVPDLASAAKPETPSVNPRTNVAPRPKPRAINREGHKSVPEFPDDVPGSAAPRNVAPRPGHLSVPLFNLPDALGDEENQSVRPSAVKQARQASKPTPPKKPGVPQEDEKPIDFRAGLKSVPKPWEKN